VQGDTPICPPPSAMASPHSGGFVRNPHIDPRMARDSGGEDEKSLGESKMSVSASKDDPETLYVRPLILFARSLWLMI
jgi:hypothetical protein